MVLWCKDIIVLWNVVHYCNFEYGTVNHKENFAIDLINVVNLDIDYLERYWHISTLVYCEIMLCKDVNGRVTDRANCGIC